jgi:Tfp pilus assembly protein PilF/predicted Ser/Thr protein kinase
MNAQLWQKLKPLFHAALAKNPQSRAAFVDAIGNNDPELKSNLQELLRSEQQSTKTLDAPLATLRGITNLDLNRFHVGELVLGRFRIVRTIGRGGMGEVYQAEDLQLGMIALKTIRQDIASSTAAFEQFRQEVQLARRVSGTQVCRIHELFLLPATGTYGPTAFLTMEYLDGVPLSEALKKRGPFAWPQAVWIALEVCEGLRLIHEHGIIHRDLKSGNIMLCEHPHGNRVVLMDFGLAHELRRWDQTAKEQNESREFDRRTTSIAGTPEYMAPEQFEGKPVSRATDIYAFGIILYELVTGMHPYPADTPVAAAIRRAQRPRPPSQINANVAKQCDRVIDRCLRYEASERFQSATDVSKALTASPLRFENLRNDRPWILWVAGTFLLIVLAGASFVFWRSRQYYRPNPETLRWYDAGVASIREGNYVKATRALQQAIAGDSRFTMAHARLAEAWNNLNFEGKAQHELLLASSEDRLLPALDRMYLNAIRATVMKDSSGQIRIYRRILANLPQNMKASGYTDLGMAYERAADPNEALANYSIAMNLDKSYAAPLMHIAMVQSRLHHLPEAEQAFQRAQMLFSVAMNQEGLAELDYARGYVANDGGRPNEAIPVLRQSLEEAKAIPSVQLEIRILIQLSSASSRSDAVQQADNYAQQAIKLARENRLDTGEAEGLVRLATVETHEGRFHEAEQSVNEALRLARQIQEPRIEALANSTLANLMNQEEQTDAVIGPAQSAMEYYKKNGYFVDASKVSILLMRAERNKGEYLRALKSGYELLDIAGRSGNHEIIWQAEILVGSVHADMEDYPKALEHFMRAKALSSSSVGRSYLALNTADVLWRLGRYSESDEALGSIGPNEQLTARLRHIRLRSSLSRRHYADALAVARQIRTNHTNISASELNEVETENTVAEAHLGYKQKVLRYLMNRPTIGPGSTSDQAKDDLGLAEVFFSIGQFTSSYESAIRAANYYSSKSLLDSELRSNALAMESAHRLNRPSDYEQYAGKMIDIASKIKQTWGPTVSRDYFSRPDIRLLTGRKLHTHEDAVVGEAPASI